MSKVIGRLELVALCLLGLVGASVLGSRIWLRAVPLAGGTRPRIEWEWPKTLQVYPASAGDPVKLIRITKAGKEVVPGIYTIPEISGDVLQNGKAVDDWLADVSFVLKNQTSKSVVSVGLGVVLPARDTAIDCPTINKGNTSWCGAYPHWCDGGCPSLISKTVHWGLMPNNAVSALRARFEAGHWVWLAFEGKERLRLAPGQEIALSLPGRGDGLTVQSDPRHGPSDVLSGITWNEGIYEASEPARLAQVPKFNIAIDVVYFEDATKWGNYGYGYALPNPDGTFQRVSAHDSGSGLQ